MESPTVPSLSNAAAEATPAPEQTATTESGSEASSQDTQAKERELQTLEKRLADTSEALKEQQRLFHEMKGQVSQLNTQVNAQPKEPEAVDLLANQEFQKRFDDDPVKGLQEFAEYERERLAKAMITVMDQRDKEWESRLTNQITVAPEKREYAAEISSLSQSVEGFDGLDDNLKVAMAKQMRAAKGPETLTPPGSPAGTGISEAERQSEQEAYQKRIQEMKNAMFGTLPEPGAELKPTVTRLTGN